MTLDMLAKEQHYADHMLPVWRALPEHARGSFINTSLTPTRRTADAVLVAGYGDVKRAHRLGYERVALIQHGAGQSYGKALSAYSGGDGHEGVSLFLCPNEHSRVRWAERYPEARAVTVGSPRAESLPARAGPPGRTVAVSFHWQCNINAETRPAFGEFRDAIPLLKERFEVFGHGHPRAMRWLRPWYRRWGIPILERFEDVCKMADVYVCDNSSTIFEFASTGRNVVLMNSKHYRRNVEHGLRFWDCAGVGVQCGDKESLPEAVEWALGDDPMIEENRERIVNVVYGQVQGSTMRAVGELLTWSAS